MEPTIQIVLPLASFDHVRAAMPSQGEEPLIGVTLEKSHATALHGALTVGLGAISPQPAEQAGQAVAEMVRASDRGALRRLRDHITEQLKGMGAE